MHTVPDLTELQETRLRMEVKYLPASPFRRSYERLCRRFEEDLADERDRLLSQCASLMLIKFIQEDIAGVTD
ncbi:hypothetical protein FHT78_000028 [Rhizobium sp. BK196]|uniref:hypothetical protein n=1 Tax=unclassified Rhizobium TaxID=2613769 RepID=UPI00161466A5|nr:MULTISPECIES: hypothetical protein [unclassified Rhizobium]MBB3308299.1 hypothetical protein [Rhizobium sp. BK196]MBB3461152.1 hypothetical protein [Rhizobium sp. BK377]